MLTCASFAIGCSGPTARTHDITAPSASGSSDEALRPMPSSGPLSFEPLFVAEPKVDGDLEDWVGRAPDIDRVAVHVTEQGMYLAGELDPGYARGAFFTVGSPVAALPEIGEPTRGGGHQELDCVHERDYIEGGYSATDRPLKPDIAKQCLEFVAAFDKQKADHAARFVKRVSVDEKGLVAVDEKGARSAIEGAKLVWKSSARGAFVFEAFLPSSAMPRLSESPLVSLLVLASPASSGAPPTITENSVPLSLAVPLQYEPNGALRTSLFAMYATPHYVESEYFVEHAGMSYLASDPAHVETWTHEGKGERVYARTDTLFVSALKVGDLEVGYTNVHSTYLSIFKAGELVDVVAPPAEVKKILERDGEIHVIAYEDSGFGMMRGYHDPAWKVLIVGKDGSAREGVEDAGFWAARRDAKCNDEWMQVIVESTPTSSASWDQLDWTGSCVTGDNHAPKTMGEAGFQVSLKWDAKKGTYVPSHKNVPVPAKKPKPKP